MLMTGDFLRSIKACQDETDWFESQWPNGLTLTQDNCLEVARLSTNAIPELLALMGLAFRDGHVTTRPGKGDKLTYGKACQDWDDDGEPKSGPLREALAQSDANIAFARLTAWDSQRRRLEATT